MNGRCRNVGHQGMNGRCRNVGHQGMNGRCRNVGHQGMNGRVGGRVGMSGVIGRLSSTFDLIFDLHKASLYVSHSPQG